MRAVLLNTPSELESPLPALGLYYLSSSLKSRNHETLLLDLWAEPLPDKALRSRIEAFKPDLIGISFYTIRYNTTCELAGKIKRWFPDTLLITGGPHPSAMPKRVLEEIEAFDLAVFGEGEITINEVIEALPLRCFEGIEGIAYRNGEGITVNRPRPYVKDLDSLPYPDLLQQDPRRYKIHPPFGWYGTPLIMVTTRGCPGRCIFCSKSVFKNSVRALSPPRIIEEIRYWQERLSVREIKFYDDDFTMLKDRTFEICDLFLEEKVNLPWSCTTRVDFLTKEMLSRMKRAGLYFISLGVESGSPKVLKALKKGYTTKHVRDAFKWCHELGIATFGYFIVGNPTETEEDIRQTMALQMEIKPDFLSWSILRIFPGTSLFDQLQGDPRYSLDSDNQYFDIYRKDIPKEYLNRCQKKAMFRHYASMIGIKSIMKYLVHTRNYRAIFDYCQVAGDRRNKQ